MKRIPWKELTLTTQSYLRWIYREIQGSRAVRRDAGFETGWTTDDKGRKWYRNVDALPSFTEWMALDGVDGAPL